MSKSSPNDQGSNLHLLHNLLQTIPDGVVVVDESGTIILANPPAEKMSGYSQQELQGQPLSMLIPAWAQDVHPGYCKSYFREPYERKMGADLNLFILRKDGAEIPVEINLGATVIAGRRYAISTIRDITERKRLEEILCASEERFRLMFQHAPLASVLTDSDGALLQTNSAFQEMLGYSEEELLSMQFTRYTLPEDLDTDWQQYRRLVAGEIDEYKLEKRYLTKNGAIIWGNLHVSALHKANGSFQAAIGMVENITERKLLEKKLNRQATTDSLTGILNRRAFFDKTGLEIARTQRYNKPCSLLIYDLDHFKAINDTYGHHTGDNVLQTLSQKVKGLLREIDIFGRIGGEEFAITLPETNAADALHVAERILKTASELAVPTDKDTIRFTISMGLATLQQQDASPEAFMRRADDALYKAKRSGRNRVVTI